jgi:hypothetical protein
MNTLQGMLFKFGMILSWWRHVTSGNCNWWNTDKGIQSQNSNNSPPISINSVTTKTHEGLTKSLTKNAHYYSGVKHPMCWVSSHSTLCFMLPLHTTRKWQLDTCFSLFSHHCLPYVHPHKIVTQVHAIAFEHTYSTSYISTLVDKNTVAMIYGEALILPGSEPYPRMLPE